MTQRAPGSKGNGVLDVIHSEVRASARRLGLDGAAASAVAMSVEERLRSELGGRNSYVPAPCGDARQRRALADIRAGLGCADVCRRHGISRATFYRLRAAVRPAGAG